MPYREVFSVLGTLQNLSPDFSRMDGCWLVGHGLGGNFGQQDIGIVDNFLFQGVKLKFFNSEDMDASQARKTLPSPLSGI